MKRTGKTGGLVDLDYGVTMLIMFPMIQFMEKCITGMLLAAVMVCVLMDGMCRIMKNGLH